MKTRNKMPASVIVSGSPGGNIRSSENATVFRAVISSLLLLAHHKKSAPEQQYRSLPTMMFSNLFLLATAVVFASTEAVDPTPVIVRVELDTSPNTGLAACSATFLTGFLAQLTGWVQQQTSHAAPDLNIGQFTLTYHTKSRRLSQASSEVDGDGVQRKAQVSSCDTSSVPGSIVACAPANCIDCGTAEFPFVVAQTPFYTYLSQTVQSLGRNYVIDPSIPDNGCLGSIPNLSFNVALVPNETFDPTVYPSLSATLAAW